MRKTVALTAALGLMAAPAFAQDQEPNANSAPQTICKGMSKKKVPGTKGQTAFAGCVSGVKRHNTDAQKNEQRQAQGKGRLKLNPARSCKAVVPALSKKSVGDAKSPYAACVSGYMKAQKAAQAAA